MDEIHLVKLFRQAMTVRIIVSASCSWLSDLQGPDVLVKLIVVEKGKKKKSRAIISTEL